MALDARVEAQKLRSMYMDDPRQQSFNLLLLGEKGVGKTKLLQTARKPVHVDSFENGGTITLRKEIIKGDILVDTRYESENPWDPKCYSAWKTQFEYKVQSKYFNNLGTYCIDSHTAWADTIMWYLLKEAGHPAEAPVFQRDYKPLRTLIDNHLEQLLMLPCDFILTGHLKPRYEKKKVSTGRDKFEIVEEIVAYDMATTGQGQVNVPRKFSEMWIMQCREGTIENEGGDLKRGNKYTLLTSRKGLLVASTRIGDGGKLRQEEEPNIKAILKKCGLDWEDRPPLYESLPVAKPTNSGRIMLEERKKAV